MKLLVIQHKAGDRFRTVQYYEVLKERGYEIEDPHWDIKTEWNRYLKQAKVVDVVWIARRMLSFFRLHQLKKANPNIVFDYDDALFMKSSRHGAQSSLSKKVKFNQMIKGVKVLAAGNEFLADVAKNHVKASKVHVLPTTVNKDWYGSRHFEEKKELVMGWLGSKSTLAYLMALYPAFRKFNEKGIPWKLLVISDAFPDWPDLPLEKIVWTLDDEKKALARIDLGLNPLKEDEWCQGKCALKAIQYMAGAAAVALSPVGVNQQLLAGGDFGWSANSEQEWLDCFVAAASNKKDSFEKGQRAREWVLENYSMESQVHKLISIFEEAIK